MFDGPTPADQQIWDAPAMSLDLSAVRAGVVVGDLPPGIVAGIDAGRRDQAAART